MKNLTFYKSLAILSLLGVIGASCSKRQPVGPSINALYGPVTITTPFSKSNATPDFSKGEGTYFTARFSNTTNWTITITGTSSGAVKVITGISSEIDATNGTWDGGADDLPSFQKEPVTAVLTFKTVKDVQQTDLTVLGNKNADLGAVVITDFTSLKFTSGWTKDWPAIDNASIDYTKPDGNSYVLMSGTPWQGSPVTPYVNYMNIPATKADVAYTKYFPLLADPTNVYFNLMVYATETPEAYIKVMFFEDGTPARSVEIHPDWTGWKLKSFRYSDLVNDLASAARPDRITAVQFVLLSKAVPAESKAVKCAFDHAVFTLYKPYQP